MEINQNPSLNMYHEIENAAGEKTKAISEIDRKLKMRVLNDGLKIIRSKKDPAELGLFEKIYPDPENSYYNQFTVFEEARQIF